VEILGVTVFWPFIQPVNRYGHCHLIYKRYFMEISSMGVKFIFSDGLTYLWCSYVGPICTESECVSSGRRFVTLPRAYGGLG
jgi:hypothetical protein